MAVSFIGGGNWSIGRKPPTCHKSLTNFYHIMLCLVHLARTRFELTTWRKAPTCRKSLTKLLSHNVVSSTPCQNKIWTHNMEKSTDLPQVTDKLYHIMLCLVHLARTRFELTTWRKAPTCHKSLTNFYHIMLCLVHLARTRFGEKHRPVTSHRQTEVIVFIGNIVMCMTSHWPIIFNIRTSPLILKISLDEFKEKVINYR